MHAPLRLVLTQPSNAIGFMSGLDHIHGMLSLQIMYCGPQITNWSILCLFHTSYDTDHIDITGKRLLVCSDIRCAADNCGFVISASFVGSRRYRLSICDYCGCLAWRYQAPMSPSCWWYYAGATRAWNVNSNGLRRRRLRVQWVATIIQLQRLGRMEGLFLTGGSRHRLY